MLCEFWHIIRALCYTIRSLSSLLLGLIILIGRFSNVYAETCDYKLLSFQHNNKIGIAFILEENSNLKNNPEKIKILQIYPVFPEIQRNNLENFYSLETQKKLCGLWTDWKKNPIKFKSHVLEIVKQEILPPIPQSKNVVAVGLNFQQHNEEVAVNDMVVFSKNIPFSSAYSMVERPDGCLLDWEVELGVVLRRSIEKIEDIQNIPPSEYIAGFVLVNDLTDRTPIIWDLKKGFSAGKTFPGFLPVGPYFVPIEYFPSELQKKLSLQMKLSVNGELKQNANTAERIHSIEAVIEKILHERSISWKLANGTTQPLLLSKRLEAGDLLITGTPGGTAIQSPRWKKKINLALKAIYQFENPKKIFIREEYCSGKYLRDQDIVSAEIEILGKQENKIVENYLSEKPISCQ